MMLESAPQTRHVNQMGAVAIQTADTALGPAEKAEIIDALYEHLTLPAACKATGYSLRAVMTAQDDDTEFSNAIAAAERHLAPMGEAELMRRAIRGVDSPVVANGRVVYVVEDGVRKPLIETKYSDTLLKTYLEAMRRDRYGPKVEITTTHKGHIAMPVFSAEMMDLMLALQRGDNKIELITDAAMTGKDALYEVIEGEFEDVTEDQQDGSGLGQGAPLAGDGADDGFDIL